MDETVTPTGPVLPAGLDSRRRRRAVPIAAALLGIAFVAAACSSGPSSPGVAGSASTSTTSSSANAASSGKSDPSHAAAALAFSQCMRAHGVTNFPDPNGQGAITIQGGGPNSTNGTSNGLDPNNPTFQAAEKACQHLMPAPTPAQQHRALSNALKQSRCMRAHGIKDFPDPQSSNGRISMSIQGGAGSDLNPNDPLFQRAQAACMPNVPKPAGGNSTKSPGNSGTGSSGSVFGVG